MPLKICDPTCSTNRNPVDTDSAKQLLQELASPDRLPRSQFLVDGIPEYLVKNTEVKIRVMKEYLVWPKDKNKLNQQEKREDTV
ncbi:UNVERIFIED_CONTAM: hypothetical protein Sindi_2622900 [Sesamum indicum]